MRREYLKKSMRPGGIDQTAKGGEGRGMGNGRSAGNVAICRSSNTYPQFNIIYYYEVLQVW